MLGLAIHTASPQLGLMLAGDDNEGAPISRYQVWDLGRDVSSHLHEKMLEFIVPFSWQDFDFIAVAKGPGGFTGTRIGVVAARTLAQQLQVPLFGISTLAAVGASRINEKESREVAIAMAAKRAAVFGAVYAPDKSGDWIALREDKVTPIEEWEAIVKQWPQPLETISIASGEGIAESVQGVMKIAIARYQKGDRPSWSSVLPFYGQHPVQK